MVAKMLCPKCRLAIPIEDINVTTDMALCRRCGSPWHYSELVEEGNLKQVDLSNPPPGAWFRNNQPNDFEVGATTRSYIALFLVPFMCVWSGFSLGGIYGSQIIHHKFNLLTSLFGIPFVLGTVLFGSFALMSVCGKVVVRVQGDDGMIFTGVGPLGWRQRFKWSGVSSIRKTEKRGNRGDTSQQITLDGEKRLNLASGLKAERLEFMLGVLRQMKRR